MRVALLALAASALLIQGANAATVTVTGPAIIVDGDTMRIGAEDIRIHGIDAPETAQKCQLPKGTWDCATAATSGGFALRLMRELPAGGRLVRVRGGNEKNCACLRVQI